MFPKVVRRATLSRSLSMQLCIGNAIKVLRLQAGVPVEPAELASLREVADLLRSDGGPEGRIIEHSIRRSNAAPTWSESSPTRPRCCGWPARFSSRPTTNSKSPTNAISPRPPWPCSTATTNRRKPLHPRPLSRHSDAVVLSNHRPVSQDGHSPRRGRG